MSRMFPNMFPEASESDAEKIVYNHFKKYGPSDWKVIHSFRIPGHKSVVFGESDFIVIAPGLGIFVLEIKGGGVGFDGSNWIFTNRYGQNNAKKRGPFEQAREGMFAIENILTDKLGEKYSRNKIMYGYGVIFTDEYNFPISKIVEDETWRLYQNVDERDYSKFVRKLASNFDNELERIGKFTPRRITLEESDLIANTLRPMIINPPPLKSFVRSSEEDIIHLTEEQYSCLEDIEINDRVVVTGGAGTGKTLIAVKDAMQSALCGEKVGVFCFNSNLARYIRNNIPDKDIDVFSFHSYLTKLCIGVVDIKDYDENSFFNDILPQTAIQILSESQPRYDKLIIDEFQDLCKKQYLSVMDKMLVGGLCDGKFTFYGDFTRQAIFSEGDSLDILKNYAFFSNKKLSINCRNTKNIGNEMVNISGFNDKSYKLKIVGEPVNYIPWSDIEDQKKKLTECIKQLHKEGFDSNRIMILSPKSRDNSVIGYCDKEKFSFGDYLENPDSYQAMFSTIHSFKGLESEVVILADIESYSDQKLMYVGLSRARSKMYVLESEEASRQRKKIMASL